MQTMSGWADKEGTKGEIEGRRLQNTYNGKGTEREARARKREKERERERVRE